MDRIAYLLLSIFIIGIITSPLASHGDTGGDAATAATPGETQGASGDTPKPDESAGKATKQAGKTDDEVTQREAEAISIDGLNAAQVKDMRERAEKFTFQAEVDRMMKLIINSLYKNKEIFLRELISNASDALDKIRFMSVTDANVLSAQPNMDIRIRTDKASNTLRIIDTGVGMTRLDLQNNLGTIAKSGTHDFLKRLSSSKSSAEMNDLIGQFGVGFYSSFLVADRVTVISKHNDDPDQHIWESTGGSFTIVKDPRGNTLKRGTEIVLTLKDEAKDYLEIETVRDLINKYSQFINFPIYLWTSKTEMVDAPAATETTTKAPTTEEKKDEKKAEDAKKEDEATVEEEKDKPKTDDKKPKKVEKTTWDWELINKNKPIWQRKEAEVKPEEYDEFYKLFAKETDGPLAKIHFSAEGEVSFKSIMFIPKKVPIGLYQNMHRATDYIKMYVRRVFITDDFNDMMPRYLNFIKGIVDSDDLPLNVSRETLQQHKLLKVIKKKLVRKVLDMIKKLPEADFATFWKQYSTSIKLGVMEDTANKLRLSKLLRFWSTNSDTKQTSLTDYVSRMKDKQQAIYFIGGTERAEMKKSPFVEKLLKKGIEVLLMDEAIDEYAVQALTEFDGKKIQNVAKEGLTLSDSAAAKEKKEALAKSFEPLLKWFSKTGLKDLIEKAEISERLSDSPCALVANTYGWSGNMERIMRAQAYQQADDPSQNFYKTQKKILEVNAKHPVIKALKKKVEENKDSKEAIDMAMLLFETATLRSGFQIQDSASFAQRIEKIMRSSLDIPADEKVEEDEEEVAAEPEVPKPDEPKAEKADDQKKDEKTDKKEEDSSKTAENKEKQEL